jgi:hypothetical protein
LNLNIYISSLEDFDTERTGGAFVENDNKFWALTLAINGQTFTEDCGTFSFYGKKRAKKELASYRFHNKNF